MTAQNATEKSAAPTCVWPLGAELGEGPLWHAAQQRLFFVNLVGNALHALDADGLRHTWQLPTYVCWLLPRKDGDGFMAGLRDGIVRLWLEPAVRIEYLHRPFDLAGLRLNDAKVDAAGRIWAGSMNAADVKRPDGKLYRLDPDGSLHTVLTEYHICNGPTFSLDGKTMFHNDSLLDRTYAYEVRADGSLGAARVWRQFGPGEGSPDGMTVDSEGCVWIAQWGGGRVCRYSLAGELLTTIPMPVAQPSSVAFGGPDLKTLYITSAWQGYDDARKAADPLAGALFSVQLDVPGVPAAQFG
ncbi:SMP-30/gluconolactonase/LRE family protein [[Empedobacter] haloabium]|uniref:SMP-30/gluconolactonase/LRE family protein n=1 Tax=[Empedobacter] haloabium TaxID=592317 RepID=A0ABZ1US93_9BURK